MDKQCFLCDYSGKGGQEQMSSLNLPWQQISLWTGLPTWIRSLKRSNATEQWHEVVCFPGCGYHVARWKQLWVDDSHPLSHACMPKWLNLCYNMNQNTVYSFPLHNNCQVFCCGKIKIRRYRLLHGGTLPLEGEKSKTILNMWRYNRKWSSINIFWYLDIGLPVLRTLGKHLMY